MKKAEQKARNHEWKQAAKAKKALANYSAGRRQSSTPKAVHNGNNRAEKPQRPQRSVN